MTSNGLEDLNVSVHSSVSIITVLTSKKYTFPTEFLKYIKIPPQREGAQAK